MDIGVNTLYLKWVNDVLEISKEKSDEAIEIKTTLVLDDLNPTSPRNQNPSTRLFRDEYGVWKWARSLSNSSLKSVKIATPSTSHQRIRTAYR